MAAEGFLDLVCEDCGTSVDGDGDCPSCDARPEAPAAPVAEPTPCPHGVPAKHRDQCSACWRWGNSDAGRLHAANARIAALEAANAELVEVVEGKRLALKEAEEEIDESSLRIAALEAELAASAQAVLRTRANAELAVQTERERCVAHVELGIKLWDREDFNAVASAIKNGDPAP